MIPLYDTIPTRRTPWMTWALILANISGFIWEARLGDGLEDALLEYGFVPARFFQWSGAPLAPAHFLPLFSAMFLHAGLLHVIGNLWFLRLFGDNVEDRLGPVGFLAGYLACGIFAGLAQGFATPRSELPMIGASGAIAGVLGTYLILYPRSRIVTLVPIFIIVPLLIEIPALVFLGLWFGWQLLSGWLSLGAPTAHGGVAFIAHCVGFAAGALLGVARRIADTVRD